MNILVINGLFIHNIILEELCVLFQVLFRETRSQLVLLFSHNIFIPYRQIGIPLFPHHNKPIRRCQRLLFACLFHTMQQSELNQNYHQSLECNLSSTTTITSLNNKHTFNQLVERFEGSYWAFSVKVFSINPSQPWAMDSFKNDWICSVSVAYGIDFNRVVFHTCIWVAYINRPSFSGIVLLKISCLSFNVFWIKHYSL